MTLPRSKRTWALLIAALAVFLAVLVFILQPNEPAYKGKPLSYWLDQLPATFGSTSGATEVSPTFYNTAQREQQTQLIREAKDAVDALGTNCLQTLVTRLACADSRAKSFARGWAVRLGLRDPPHSSVSTRTSSHRPARSNEESGSGSQHRGALRQVSIDGSKN